MSTQGIHVTVDPANPGQFFACCGLLELGHRKWSNAEGWFEGESFHIACAGSLTELLAAIAGAPPLQLDRDDDMASPLFLPALFSLRLDWWTDDQGGGSVFKTWAGQQKVVRIAAAMHAALGAGNWSGDTLFETGALLYDAVDKNKPVEPFYFDCRRAAQAHSLDVGFSADAHDMQVPVYSAVEYLCLIGLQRFRPERREDRRFGYRAWSCPLAAPCAAAVAPGAVPEPGKSFAFPLLYRTKYLKGLLPATQIGEE
jgi:CRISPR-associated protein Csb3